MITVEVAYAKPDDQLVLSLEVAKGSSVEEAIKTSGILDRFPEIDLASNKVGVFGKAAKLADEVSEGSRIEIYRPLIADPKQARKKRAEKQQVAKED